MEEIERQRQAREAAARSERLATKLRQKQYEVIPSPSSSLLCSSTQEERARFTSPRRGNYEEEALEQAAIEAEAHEERLRAQRACPQFSHTQFLTLLFTLLSHKFSLHSHPVTPEILSLFHPLHFPLDLRVAYIFVYLLYSFLYFIRASVLNGN